MILELFGQTNSNILQLKNINNESEFSISLDIITFISNEIFNYDSNLKSLSKIVNNFISGIKTDLERRTLEQKINEAFSNDIVNIRNANKIAIQKDKLRYSKILLFDEEYFNHRRRFFSRSINKLKLNQDIEFLLNLRDELLEIIRITLGSIIFINFKYEAFNKKQIKIEDKYVRHLEWRESQLKKKTQTIISNKINNITIPDFDDINIYFEKEISENESNINRSGKLLMLTKNQYKYNLNDWNIECYNLFCYLVDEYKHDFISQKFTNIWYFMKSSGKLSNTNYTFYFQKKSFITYIQKSNPQIELKISFVKSSNHAIEENKLNNLFYEFNKNK